jgi:tetratricopeptide (TPR) repeat protein
MRIFVYFFFASSIALPAENAITVADPQAEKIASAHAAIVNSPKSWQPHIDLATELCHKARDSKDAGYYKMARAELRLALDLSPGNYDARKGEVAILPGERDLTAALKLASELNRSTPDDPAIWALLAGINTALGRYSDALRDAQWVLDLRPGSALGFLEAARLREEYGDGEGATEFYEEAMRRIPFGDLVERAWLLTRMGNVALRSGDLEHAAERFESALKVNPESRIAEEGLAHTRIAEGDYEPAIATFRRQYSDLRDAASLYALADALRGSGRSPEASSAFQEFEAVARPNIDSPANANIELIYYYADQEPRAPEALKLAERERALRRDSRTLAACAWALYANKRYEEAGAGMREALATGTRGYDEYCAAASISAALNDPDAALQHMKQANALRPGAA